MDIVSKNGNLLLNVGPKADGTISDEDQAVLKGIGVSTVLTVNPLNLNEAMGAVRMCADLPGVKAIIFKSPCVAISKPVGKCHITENCLNCGKCIKEIGCPGLIRVDGRVTIDPNLCTGCGLCSQICPVDAIQEVER